MILGRYGGTSKCPQIEVRLSLPSQRLNADLSLVFDTGATSTFLSPTDAAKIGLDYSKLTFSEELQGVTGKAKAARIPGVLTVRAEDNTLYVYDVQVTVVEPDPTVNRDEVPSLLGRDVISCWKTNYDPTFGLFECEPLRWSRCIGPAAPKLRPRPPLRR
jgi:aspartyl protease